MITAIFEPGKDYAVAEGLWQHDRGQVLRIEGLDLPDNAEVDFSLNDKGGEAVPCVGVKNSGGVLRLRYPMPSSQSQRKRTM